MSNIYDLANELNRTFRELPEYKAVLESKAAIDADRTNADTRVAIRNEVFRRKNPSQCNCDGVFHEAATTFCLLV